MGFFANDRYRTGPGLELTWGGANVTPFMSALPAVLMVVRAACLQPAPVVGTQPLQASSGIGLQPMRLQPVSRGR